MNRKPRPIVVDSHNYLWRVARSTPAQVCLRIWQEGRKALPWAEVMCRCDDFWLFFSDITRLAPAEVEENFDFHPLKPRQVAEIIRTLARRDEAVSGKPVRRVFELGAQGSLVAVAPETV